jgi:hypothetical protein
MAHPQQRLNLSPATLSRFTTIHLPAYSPQDLEQLLLQQLVRTLAGGQCQNADRQAKALLVVLLSLKGAVEQKYKRQQVDARQLMRCISFIAAHETEALLLQRLMVGFRWFVLDVFEPDLEQQQHLVKAWLEQVDQVPGVLPALQQLLGSSSQLQRNLQKVALAAFDDPPDVEPRTTAASMFKALPCGHVRLEYTGVAGRPAAATLSGAGHDGVLSPSSLACTPSLVINMARILAATTIRGPLLLEGPPGIGKTAVVEAMACLLGYPCERVNLSGSVTLGQLLGSYVPQVVGGQRVFTWQEGVLVRALRRGAWVLLDEVNLAPPEVLAAVAPLLDR